MRLLTHTGIVGFGLFAAFVIAAVAAAFPARRRGNALTRAAVAISLLPMVVWLVHGSIDWFWEMPALTGPAVGFLALAGALGDAERRPTSPRAESLRIPTVAQADRRPGATATPRSAPPSNPASGAAPPGPDPRAAPGDDLMLGLTAQPATCPTPQAPVLIHARHRLLVRRRRPRRVARVRRGHALFYPGSQGQASQRRDRPDRIRGECWLWEFDD